VEVARERIPIAFGQGKTPRRRCGGLFFVFACINSQ
jgi:hypothetical protein